MASVLQFSLERFVLHENRVVKTGAIGKTTVIQRQGQAILVPSSGNVRMLLSLPFPSEQVSTSRFSASNLHS